MVTIFTSNTCAYCTMAKKFLKYKGVDYQEKNIDENPEYAKEAFEISGSMAVPVIYDGERVAVGYNLPKIAEIATMSSIYQSVATV
jgi:glutaredoxin